MNRPRFWALFTLRYKIDKQRGRIARLEVEYRGCLEANKLLVQRDREFVLWNEALQRACDLSEDRVRALEAALHQIAGTHGTECSSPRYVAAQALNRGWNPSARNASPTAAASPHSPAPDGTPDKPA